MLEKYTILGEGIQNNQHLMNNFYQQWKTKNLARKTFVFEPNMKKIFNVLKKILKIDFYHFLLNISKISASFPKVDVYTPGK